MNQARKTALFLVFMIIVSSLFTKLPAHAETTKQPKVLVAFSSPSGEYDEQQRVLDLLLGHFTSDITFKKVKDVTSEDLKGVTHLFYYGQKKEILPHTFGKLLSSFDGTVVALGHNIGQLGERYSFLEMLPEQAYTKISIVGDENKTTSVFPQTILQVRPLATIETLIKVTHGVKTEYPLFLKRDKTYYYAATLIQSTQSIFLAEAFHKVFKNEHSNIRPGYIRLEDIHPMVDPKNVMDIAKELKKREIPYMVAVIPVYTNPETKKEYHFSDSPQLLKALKYMQDNGGSIVLHGHTHQFRTSETGEGFEFWDVDNNMPIYHGPEEKVVNKTATDFSTPEEYETYQKSQLKFETEYIEEKLERGVAELANYGIYPLAFEAPHYTMSQNGYKTVSRYFSTYVGQVQISDKRWEAMTTSPYITTPTFLHGMQLLPETIGFVDPEDPYAINTMSSEAKRYSVVRDGFVAGFFHPYLGVENFKKLLDELEKISNVKWIDLKQLPNTVTSQYVDIDSKKGEITVDIDRQGLYSTSFDYVMFHVKEFLRHATWAMVGAGTLAVLLFTLYGFFVRRKIRRDFYG